MILKSKKGGTISSLIFFLVLVIIAFVLFKVIKSNVDNKSLKAEVTEKIGNERGADLGEARIAQIIADVVAARGCELLDAAATINAGSGKISVRFSYEKEIDFLITKVKKTVEEDYLIEAYGY
jgi:hypothetical protein